jgi:predicted glutamine amidotransferase
MCIIIAKPAGRELPSSQILKNCFSNNGDGAGIAYTKGGCVVIDKGIMSFAALENKIKQLSKEINISQTPIIIHFRIGTAGANNAENTHPYPLEYNIQRYKALHLETSVAVAHNGILPKKYQPRDKNKHDMNDTQIYIYKRLSKYLRFNRKFYLNKKYLKRIALETGNKFAFLDGKGNLTTCGAFIEEDGILYSNNTYAYNFNELYRKNGVYNSLYNDSYYDDEYMEFNSRSEALDYLNGFKLLRKGDVLCLETFKGVINYVDIDEDGAYYYDASSGLVLYYDNKYNSAYMVYDNVIDAYSMGGDIWEYST